mgnify:CR=1 FL=1
MKEHFGVGGFLSADKNHHIVAACKILQTLDAVSDIAANGIVVFEDCVLAFRLFASSPSRLNLRHNLLKLLDGLGGLGEEVDGAREIE